MGCFGRQPKKQRCTIVLLDETDIVYDIESKTTGEDVLQFVFNNLNLLETAYFGLRYIEKSGESRWLDPTRKVFSQITGTAGYTLYFGVKFYASDPCRLQEEITRYQFVLQIKQDIFQGRLIVSPELGVELFALSLQSELGDYDSRRHDKHYVSEFRFLPHQTPDLEQKVAERHKNLIGQVSSTVEMTFLEKVKWLDMYGVDLHVVMGDDSVEYFLCLSPSGIIVMKNGNKISNYFWPRITKVFFKGKYFMLRVINKANEENTYAFELPCKNACKYLWKCCIEHHAFFRLTQVKDVTGVPVNIFRLGSKHRYSGRTEQQIKADMKQIKRPPPTVVRVPSRRYPKRLGEPDGAEADHEVEEQNLKVLKSKDDLSISQPPNSLTLYRSVSTPAELSTIDASNDTKVAPWENPNQKGLFSNSSRQSLCSSHVSEKRCSHRSQPRGRSPSLNSEVSMEYRRKRHKSKRSSDNESDISKSSKGSRGSKSSKNSHRKSRTHENTSDTDSYSKRRGRRHRNRGQRSDLVDSDVQWKLVQQRQERNAFGPQSAVVRDLSNRKSGYMNSGIDTESEATMNHRRKQRRHSRSRSRSPESKHAISEDVKKHIKYNLIDPSCLTEEEKKDIQYTKVETNNEVLKVRYSPASGRPRYKIAKVPSRTSLEKVKVQKNTENDAPPPYTVSQVDSNISNQSTVKSISHQNDMRKLSAYHSTTGASDSSSSSMSSVLKPRNRNQHSQAKLSALNTKVQSVRPTGPLNKTYQDSSCETERDSYRNSKPASSVSDESPRKKPTHLQTTSNIQEKIAHRQVCKRQVGNTSAKPVNTPRRHELRTEL